MPVGEWGGVVFEDEGVGGVLGGESDDCAVSFPAGVFAGEPFAGGWDGFGVGAEDEEGVEAHVVEDALDAREAFGAVEDVGPHR